MYIKTTARYIIPWKKQSDLLFLPQHGDSKHIEDNPHEPASLPGSHTEDDPHTPVSLHGSLHSEEDDHDLAHGNEQHRHDRKLMGGRKSFD